MSRHSYIMIDLDILTRTYQFGLIFGYSRLCFKSKNESRKQLNFAALLKYKKYNFGFGLE